MTAAASILIAALLLGDAPPTPSPQTPAPAAQADTAAPPPPTVAPQPPAVPTARPITLRVVSHPAPAPPAPEAQEVVLHVTADPQPQPQAVTLSVQPSAPAVPAPAATPAAAVPATVKQPCLVGRIVGHVGECLAKHGQPRVYLPRPAAQTAAWVAPATAPVQQVVYVVSQPVVAAPVPQAVTASPQSQAVTLPVAPRKGGLFGR